MAVSTARGATPPPSLHRKVDQLLGPPRLLPGEDGGAYDELLSRVREAVAPADFIEEVWVRDVVDLSWEILRLRRLKSELLVTARYRGALRLLTRLGSADPFDLTQRWFAGEKKAKLLVELMLRAAGLTEDAILAEGFAECVEPIERIDRMTMNAEARRNAVLREIERHRGAMAQRLRLAAEAVEAAFTAELDALPAP